MWIVFIIILVVVGAFAVWFNIWNHKDNKKKEQQKQPKKLHLDKSYEQTTRPQTVDELEQTERILKMFKDREDSKK